MEIITTARGVNLVVEVSGEIDHHGSEEIKERLDREIKRHSAKNIIFDFSKVSFMDSSGVGLIMGRYKLMGKQGGNVALCNMAEDIRRIFRISGLGAIIKDYATAEAAIRAMEGK